MDHELLTGTRHLIAECVCENGCPGCVGPMGNTGPLAKAAALRILDLLLGTLPAADARAGGVPVLTTLADRLRDVIRPAGSNAAPGCAPGPAGPDLPGQDAGSETPAIRVDGAPGRPRRGMASAERRVMLRGRDPPRPGIVVTAVRQSGPWPSRLADAAAAAALVARAPAALPFVFFDLETTGLGGGAGTYAFLVGCGWFDHDGGFVTRQYLLVRIAGERSLLALVAGELARAGALVSFNGKSFDVPMLETRYLYHRLEWAAAQLPHLDMLHVARRFWRGGTAAGPDAVAAGSSCSLSALERQPLGTRRQGDVPGFEIPARYFHFVRTGDARPLQIVFEHNRLDLLSLAALTARALHLVRTGPGRRRDPREALALGWIYARAGLRCARPSGLPARNRSLLDDGRWPAASSSAAIHVEALRSLAADAPPLASYDAGGRLLAADPRPPRRARGPSLVKRTPRSPFIMSIACAISRRRKTSPCAAWNTARTGVAGRRPPSGGPTREEDELLRTGTSAGPVRT